MTLGVKIVMKGEKLLSIIVPFFNDALFIGTCIESILNQSYKTLELIMVDDGSTDNSLQICKKYRDFDSRVRLIQKKNEGPIMARYAGLQLVRSEYVMFVDGDDWISSDMCRILMNLKMRYDSDVVISGLNGYYNRENIVPPEYLIEEDIYYKQDLKEKVYPYMFWNNKSQRFGVDPSLCGKVFTKHMLLQEYQYLKNFKFHYGEDVAVTYPLLLKTNSVVFINRAFYFHRKKMNRNVADYIKDCQYFSKLLILYDYLKKIYAVDEMSKELIIQLEYFYMYSVNLKKMCYQESIVENKYLFPFDKVKKGSNIILYGAGQVGQTYYQQIIKLKYCKLIAWIDKNYQQFEENEYKIVGIDLLDTLDYDFIVIANANCHIRKTIINGLIEKKVKREKIL